MENQNRTLFGLGGIGGLLVATAILLTILVVLTYFGLNAQKEVANKPYKIENASSIPALVSPGKAGEFKKVQGEK